MVDKTRHQGCLYKIWRSGERNYAKIYMRLIFNDYDIFFKFQFLYARRMQ